MSISDQEEKRIEAIVSATLEQYRLQREPPSCALGIGRESHDKEHAFVRDLMQIACKLEKIKWGFLGTAVKTMGGILIAAVFIGLIYLVKQRAGALG